MNRKSFVKKILLFSGALSLNFKSSSLYALGGKKEVTGNVSSAGKALANVLVSDGYSFAKTDSKGNYRLNTHPDAEFVFISTPSGYEFQHNNQIANFYHSLKTESNYNFKLDKLSKQDNKHSFIIWADPQVKNKKDVEQMMETSVPDVKKVLKDTLHDDLVHGICVGDIVWDSHDLFSSYNEGIAKMGIPFFQTLGNHDEDYGLGGDETSDQTFKKHYGPTYYSFNRGKAHYVVLDDVRYLGTERNYDGFITEQQLNWLAEDLKYVDKNSLLIICTHIPVHNQVKNNNDLYKLLADFKNVHIMSGHTHFNSNVITNNVFEHNHGTVCGAWWTGPICGDGTPRGYAVYHVEGNDLKWYYKPTGLPKEKQISLHVDELNNQKRLIANVWNHDPKWKVEYWADGKYMGEMENQKGYDPLSIKLYKGDDLPAQRHFVEPHETEHIFLAHFNADVKEVKVVATDRFGDKYEEKVSAS